jgi:hypothetical protein|tara:strand:- start:1302 stop:1571 length:270 start_codon:yes stop_codon:yes gene_type:complete
VASSFYPYCAVIGLSTRYLEIVDHFAYSLTLYSLLSQRVAVGSYRKPLSIPHDSDAAAINIERYGQEAGDQEISEQLSSRTIQPVTTEC